VHGQDNILISFLIYLAAMVIVVPLSKKIGLGAVLGYLLAGVLIGPFGLNIIETSKAVISLAELGIVLMLFTIGLELNLNRLWSMRNLVFGFGFMQMTICGVLFSAIGLLAFDLAPAVAIIIGMTLALSSTAVVIQLMNDRNLMDTKVGKSVFGVLLFQDIAAIPILISISILYPSEGAHQFNVLYAVGAVLGLIIVGKYFLSYALRWIAKNSSRELFVGAALLLVILVMELMTMVGISAGLGAFIAGVLLASSEYRHELEADLDPFKGLFLGLFFITIGANMDLKLLVAIWPIILGLLSLFVMSKVALIYVQATILKMASKERFLFSNLLSQGGEFGFVVVTIGVAGQMINPDIAARLNLVIALSIARYRLY
jgi:glutathione-regulated potassium-efflux system ancillary protein KefC